MQSQWRTGAIGSGTGAFRKEQTYSKPFSALLFLYCAFLPFEEALATAFGSILKIIGLVIIFYAVAVFWGCRIKVKNVILLVPFGIWILWSFFSVIWSESFAWWYYFFKIYLFQFAFVLVVAAFAEKIDINYILNGLIAGATLSSIILIFFPKITSFTSEGRRTVIVFGREFDPNIVACIIMLGIFACTIYIFQNSPRKTTLKFLAVFLFVGMLLTGSRGALISFVLAFGMELFFELNSRGNKKQARRMIFIAVLAVIVALSVLPQNLLEGRFTLQNLFGQREISTGVHNRYTIWKYGIELFFQSPIIGYGCGNFFDAIASVYRECASHNLYLLIFTEGGLIGALVFLSGMVRIAWNLLGYRLYSLIAFFASICIMALTLDIIPCKFFWVGLLVAIIMVSQQNNGENAMEDE